VKQGQTMNRDARRMKLWGGLLMVAGVLLAFFVPMLVLVGLGVGLLVFVAGRFAE
jgi:hypothetical protein